jgi:hypothetical protein
VRLAHYFQCTSLLGQLEACFTTLVHEAIYKERYDSLWKALLLADTNQWSCLDLLMETLAKDDDRKRRSCWRDVTASKSRTLASFVHVLNLLK